MTEFSQTSPLPAASASKSPLRVALILSSKLERLGWGIVVDGQADMQVAGQFPSLAPALASFASNPVDVALVDEALLTPRACEAIRKRAPAPSPRILVIGRHPLDHSLAASQYSFASGYLLKGLPAADLLAAIRERGIAAGSHAPALDQERANKPLATQIES